MTKLIGVTTPNSTFESRASVCSVLGCVVAASTDEMCNGMCHAHAVEDQEQGIEQARELGENMAKYGTIDKPAEKFCLSIYLIASDGSHDVLVNSEQEAMNHVRILDMNMVDYIELYRVHDVPEGDNPYEHIRTMKIHN